MLLNGFWFRTPKTRSLTPKGVHGPQDKKTLLQLMVACALKFKMLRSFKCISRTRCWRTELRIQTLTNEYDENVFAYRVYWNLAVSTKLVYAN